MLSINLRFSRPNILWRIGTRIGTITRAMAAGKGSTYAVISVVITIFVGLFPALINRAPFTINQAIITLVVTIITALIITSYVTWYSLKRLSPKEYAPIAIGGLSIPKVFRIICYEIWKACDQVKDNKGVKNLYQLIPADASQNIINYIHNIKQDEVKKADFIKLLAALKKHHIDIKKLVRKQHSKLQRIQELKLLASKELSIPPRRLCDHIFQYSPAMHQAKIEKYEKNCEELVYSGLTYFNDFDRFQNRFDALIRENIRIYEKFTSRIRYQAQIFKYVDLHPFIKAFASEHSTSASLKNYARSISQAAKYSKKKLDGYNSRIFKREREYRRFNETLKFLFFKQRAHPGFDLHYALSKLFQNRLKECEHFDKNSDERTTLLIIGEVLKRPMGDSRNDIVPYDNNAYNAILKLTELTELVDISIEKSREEIISKFVTFYNRWFGKNANSEKFLLTHGYSKTVREIFKRGLSEIIKKDKKIPKKENTPRIFIMKSDSEDNFDTRLMEFELKEDMRFPIPNDISAGDENLFVDLLESNTKIMVVLGAECFDEKLRVVHPRGIAHRLKKLKETLQKRCVITVVAEGYKHHKNLIKIPAFYQDHIDRIDLYEAGLIDFIISDNTIKSKYIL